MVERQIVRDEDVLAQEVQKVRKDVLDRGLVEDHGRRDPGDTGDPAGDGATGVDQRRKRVDDLTASDANGSQLDDPIPLGAEAGGLGVDDDVGGAGEVQDVRGGPRNIA